MGCNYAKRTQFPAAEIPRYSIIPAFQPMPFVQNEAKLGQPGISGELCWGSPLRKTCETNPISPRRTGRRGRGWSQSCETNPVSGEVRGTRPQGRGTRGQVRKTEPISGEAGGTRPQGCGAEGKCAKRTQFPAVGIPQHSTIPPFRPGTDCAKQSQLAPTGRGWHRRPGSRVPPTRGESCGTNPIRMKNSGQHPPPCARPHPTSAFSSYCSGPVRSVN
jgi:hypothetical protein